VIFRKGKRKLIGVASKGLESCETIEPEVFTRVDNFLEWIEEVIKNN
jgi:secreted trypsin-like serine protease